MPAYLIADIKITDPATFDEYRKLVPPLIAAHGGRYLARGGASEVLEGAWKPNRTVVLEFPTMAALRAFWTSPEYQPLREMRERSSTSSMIAVEGI